MNLKSITFGFENCESITIDGKYVCQFLVDDIHAYFARIACNAITKVDIADTFVIEIAAMADKPYKAFGQLDPTTSKFKRFLAYNDITSIDFTLYNDYGDEPNEETYSYWLGWKGDCEEINEAQTTYLSDLGNLYIVVSKDKTFDDYFNKEEINDKDETSFHFDMCDIPYKKEES
ncbi:MAG: hypothetical protein NC218_09480 [Acetobacter sp.]|nr:hypothetical protein [Acetobacter sp.]